MSTLGTEYKINVYVEPIDGFHMSDYEWECDLFVYSNKKVKIRKQDAKKIDVDNYVVIVNQDDALRIGAGEVKLEFTAYIPDVDFKDGFRTEKTVVCTGVTIVSEAVCKCTFPK